EWQRFESMLRSDQLIWMAEYNAACIQELRKRIGPSDEAFYAAQQFLDSNPSVIQTLQEKSTLVLEPANSKWRYITDILPGILFELKRRLITFQLSTLKMKQCNLSGEGSYLFLDQPIQEIKLTEVNHITDNGLKFFAEGCPNIQRLDLHSSKKITDIGLKYIA